MKFKLIVKTSICLILVSLGLISAPLGYAEMAVIVHPSNTSELSPKIIQRIFLGKLKTFPGGGAALPLEHPAKSVVRENFNKEVLNKSSQQMRSYWGRLIFTGKGLPPKEVDTSEEIIRLVKTNPNTVGYVDMSLINSDVRVVHKF